ncbi:kinase-like domain-containing protein [Globomyces pollinis-pini]|nr:kinase-like domain-containing protein [Globomyces pollinis-pini]
MLLWDPLSESFLNTYEMKSLVAIGGRGTVVKVLNKKSNKIEIAKFVAECSVINWFHGKESSIPQEVNILRQCDHPNIIKIVEYFTFNTGFCHIMEYPDANWDSGSDIFSTYLHRNFPPSNSEVDFATDHLDSLVRESSKLNIPTIDLFNFISTYHPLDETILRHIFRQMAAGVHYMHSQDMIHRDLKDENIVIDSNLNPKLIDFDVASFAKPEKSVFQGVVGTIQYTAPESLRNGCYEGKPADIWSLGVTLYVMCKDKLPFQNSLEIIQAVDLSTLESVPIKDLCSAMLNLNPSERPTIQEVLNHPWLML